MLSDASGGQSAAHSSGIRHLPHLSMNQLKVLKAQEMKRMLEMKRRRGELVIRIEAEKAR